MLISRGQPVGSIHWAQLADYEAAAAEREEAEAREQSRAYAQAEDVDSKPHAVVEVDGVGQGSDEIGIRSDDAHPVEPIGPRPGASKPKPGPGRPRKDYS